MSNSKRLLCWLVCFVATFEAIEQFSPPKLTPGLPIHDTLSAEWMPFYFACIWDDDRDEIIFPKDNVINDSVTYCQFKNSIYLIEDLKSCKNKELQDVDFSQYSVIWYTVPYEGCRVASVEVSFGRHAGVYVINVTRIENGRCRFYNKEQFFFKVDKIPDDVKVEFQVYGKRIPAEIYRQLPY